MFRRQFTLLFALAIWCTSVPSAFAQAKNFIMKDTGGPVKLVYDPYINAWVGTRNPLGYARSSVDKHTVDGFGGKLSAKEFQHNTPVTDAAVAGAKTATNVVTKVPRYGGLAKPLQRMVYKYDHDRLAQYK